MTLVVRPGHLPGDSLFSDVSLLLKGDGTNGSTTITDSSPSPRNVTANNGAVISTAEYKYGNSSIYFNGTTHSLTFNGPTLGTGNFTIECWLKTNSTVQYAQIIGNEISAGVFSSDGFTLLINNNASNDGRIRFYVSGLSGTLVLGSSTVSYRDNAWHHIAVTRSGNDFKLWVDGSLNGTGTSSDDVDGAATWYVGANNVFSPRNLIGYVDELRITKSVARYAEGTGANAGKMVFAGTNTLALPTEPFPDGQY